MSCNALHSTRRTQYSSPPHELPSCNLNSAFLIDTNDFMTIQKNDDDDLQKALRTLTRQRLLTQSQLSWAGLGWVWIWGLGRGLFGAGSVIELAVQTFDKLMNCNAQVATVQRTASTDDAEIDNVTKEGPRVETLTVVATPTEIAQVVASGGTTHQFISHSSLSPSLPLSLPFCVLFTQVQHKKK